MKNFILSSAAFFAFAVLGTNTLSAQKNTATTTVNIMLKDVISIDDNSVAAGGVVDFNYETAADYNNDKSVEVKNSLLVTSSKAFDIKVKAGDTHFKNGTNSIPVNVLTITAAPGGTMTGTPTPVVLSSTKDQNLITGADKGALRSLNINYTIPAAKAQTELLGKPAGTYTQTVTYTATAN